MNFQPKRNELEWGCHTEQSGSGQNLPPVSVWTKPNYHDNFPHCDSEGSADHYNSKLPQLSYYI